MVALDTKTTWWLLYVLCRDAQSVVGMMRTM
jgi:hypothetical protein